MLLCVRATSYNSAARPFVFRGPGLERRACCVCCGALLPFLCGASAHTCAPHMARNTLQSVGTLACEKQPGSILLTAARPIVFPVPCAPSGIAHQLDAGDPAREQAVGGCADFVCSRLSESTQARTMRRCQNHATLVLWAEAGSSKATRSVIE